MTTEASIKAYLDSISQLPGSILYRDRLAWQALPPGQAGDYLALTPDLLPAWVRVFGYYPALMQYNGASTYYLGSLPSFTNAPITILTRFSSAPVPGSRLLHHFRVAGRNYETLYLLADGTLQVTFENSAGATLCRLRSLQTFDDEKPHYCFTRFNPTAGIAKFFVDGADADSLAYPSRILTAGTPPTGSGGTLYLGRTASGSTWWPSTIGAFGFRQTEAPDWSDFMGPTGHPLKLDQTGWTEWGSQPPAWHESGQMDANRGSMAPFTRFGPLDLADPSTWS